MAIEGIRAARKGEIGLAKKNITKASEMLSEAHKAQTGLIQNEVAGNKIEMSLLMVHAQDHLMNAITVVDLAAEMIDLCNSVAQGRIHIH